MPSILTRFPEFRKKALTLSYDDGVVEDRHLIEIIDKYKIKATFNLISNTYTEAGYDDDNQRLSRHEAIELYKNSPHEVAIHSHNHPWLAQIPSGVDAWEIIKNREILEEMFGRIVNGMAYPEGSYDERVIRMLKSCGVEYARCVATKKDNPGLHKFDLPNDWYNWNGTCRHRDPELMTIAEEFLSAKIRGDSKLFYLWGHSYEFDRHNNWDSIENFCKLMGNNDAIWYATNGEICSYIKASQQIKAASNGTILHNPTAKRLWLEIDSKNFILNAGDTLYL